MLPENKSSTDHHCSGTSIYSSFEWSVLCLIVLDLLPAIGRVQHLNHLQSQHCSKHTCHDGKCLLLVLDRPGRSEAFVLLWHVTFDCFALAHRRACLRRDQVGHKRDSRLTSVVQLALFDHDWSYCLSYFDRNTHKSITHQDSRNWTDASKRALCKFSI